MTVLSFTNKLVSVASESAALKEDRLVYLMNKMTANSKWFPYQQLMIERKLQSCVDFGNIKIHHPASVSLVTGFFKTVEFQFNDTTVKMFAYDLQTWVKDANEVELAQM